MKHATTPNRYEQTNAKIVNTKEWSSINIELEKKKRIHFKLRLGFCDFRFWNLVFLIVFISQKKKKKNLQRDRMAQATRSTGKVTWFDDVKGYGFIKPDDGGADLFVHQKSIKSDGYRTLYENQSVEFDVQLEADGKYQALDVTAPGGAPIQSPKKEAGFGGGGRGGGGGGHGGGFGGNWKSDGRRNGGGGGGGGGVVCYNCDGVGHLARDCTSGRRGGGGGGGGGGCYNCGDHEHFARDCPRQQGVNSSGGGGGGNCFKCGGFGHLARECTNRGGGGGGSFGGGGGGGRCYNCGRSGHLARECTEGGSGGGGGGFGGRFGGGGAGGSTCFNCGKPGHFARECTKVSV